MTTDADPDGFDRSDEDIAPPLARRAFFRRLGRTAGGTAAAAALLPLTAPGQSQPQAGAASRAGAPFNVRDFGARGDHATDDTVAIQAAMDAAAGAGGGGVVYFPAGTYLTGAALSHKGRRPIIFQGEGVRNSIIKARRNFDELLLLEGGAYGVPVVSRGAVRSVTVRHGGLYTAAPTVRITGDGRGAAGTAVLTHGRVTGVIITAGGTGYTRAEVEFGASEKANRSLGFECYDMAFVTTGTRTSCVHVARGAWQWHFENCRFSGDGASTSLFKTYGSFGNLRHFIFDCGGASTVGLNILGKMINSHIAHGRFGSIGRGFQLHTPYGPTGLHGGRDDRPQGITFDDIHSLCTGAWNARVGNALYIKFIGCWFTESSGNQVIIDNRASEVYFGGCHFGGGNDTIRQVVVRKGAGNHVSFLGCSFNHGASAIRVEAGAREQLYYLQIIGCLFQNVAIATLDLDSVVQATITGNIDTGRPRAGSWITASSHAKNKGDYTFDDNHWHSAPPAVFATAATYHWGLDTGIVMRARGTFSATESRSATAPHGLSRAPSWCQGTPTEDVGRYWNSVKTDRRIGFSWSRTASSDWHWEAEV